MRGEKRLNLINILFFAIPFASGMIYLLAFYPGIISYDSIFQWDQIFQFKFNNWHPAYHTILMWLLTRIIASPAMVGLFQIAVFSAVTGYGLLTFKNLGAPAALLLPLSVLIATIPINGMMVITLWKDVLYGLAVLLLTIYLFKIICSRGGWLGSGWNWLFFGLTLAHIGLLRKNGFPVAFGTLLAVLLLYKNRKPTLLAAVTTVVFMGIILGPVYAIFQVDRDNPQAAGVVFIHPLGAFVNAGAAFSDQEAAYLNQIHLLETGWPYSCYDATVLFYDNTSFRPVQDDPITALKLLIRLSLANPMVAARHFYCLSSFVWKIPQPDGVLLETIYTSNQDLANLPDWQKYAPVIDQNSKLPVAREMMLRFLDNYARWDVRKIAWRPAIYLYLFSVSVLFYAYRRKNPFILLLLLPAALQTMIIAVSAHLQALRYQYPIYLVAMLFSIPLLYLALKKPAAALEAAPQ